MVEHFEAFTDISEFNRYELREVFTEGSLFRIFLHLFFCKRSCDTINRYCWKFSLVKDKSFQNLILFDDVFLGERDYPSKLGIDNKTLVKIFHQHQQAFAKGKDLFSMRLKFMSYSFQY